MIRPIPYAGYDPDEDNFDGIELASLYDQDKRPYRTTIDIRRAWDLKRIGHSWAEIGKILARECDRRMPFTSRAVYWAANYCCSTVTSQHHQTTGE
jgi:hypothetical protein